MSRCFTWVPASTGVGGTAENGDGFGTALAPVRVTQSAEYDLVVGVPFEGLGAPIAGMIQLLPGSPAGLTGIGTEAFDDNTAGVKGASCGDCGFGLSLSSASDVNQIG